MSRDFVASPGLPWRGPGPGRPDLPMPPHRMPIRRGGRWRKRWRYLGAYCDELLLCAARVQVGKLGQTFWAIWDRERGEMWERTRMRLPGARGEVWTEARDGEGGYVNYAPDEGSLVRIEAPRGERQVRAFLRPGAGRWVEAVCPNGEGEYVWTRKRADVPVQCDVRVGERRWQVEARGMEDESAGYHPRHTVWSWSAGVGRTRDGRSVGWNLVSGINDPAQRSERAIWVDGKPFEPGPVELRGLGGDRLRRRVPARVQRRVRAAKASEPVVLRYSYRQPFGKFSGTLPGGLELDHGLGVMEHHDAHW